MKKYLQKFHRSSLKKKITIVAVASLLIHSLYLCSEWYLVSDFGYNGRIVHEYSKILFIPLGISIIGVVGSILSIYKFGFKILASNSIMLLCITYLTIGFGYTHIFSRIIENWSVHKIEQRSGKIIRGIEEYNSINGIFPKTLEQLIPEHLESTPSTGVPEFSNYRYEVNPRIWFDNPWVLYIECPKGKAHFDKIVYLPKLNYPEEAQDGVYRVVGNWAYFKNE